MKKLARSAIYVSVMLGLIAELSFAGGPPLNPYCEEGRHSAEADNYRAALSSWEKLSLDNSPKERLRSILLCLKAARVAHNDFSASQWIFAAAEADIADAQMYAGMVYASGVGVEQDFDRAQYWFKRSVANGNDIATRLLEILEKNQKKQTQ